jgi:cell wall-associated NlpC family hydrolase
MNDYKIASVFTEQEERERVVAIARTWERTPYRHMGRVKGAGADCLTLLAEVFQEASLVPKIDIEFYPKDWMHHRSAERYLEGLLKYTTEIFTTPRPGDILLYKVGRCFSHGAIVIDYPTIIHAQTGVGVLQENAENASWLNIVGENTENKGKPRERRAFSYWGR